MISLIHPSRGRVQKSMHTIRKWRQNYMGCDGPLELIVSCDVDDFHLKGYVSLYGSSVLINENRSSVEAINNAAKVAQGDILMVVSDDTDCMDQWNFKILKEVEGKSDWILKTQDGIQDWIITMPIMDRAYYNRFCYIYHPSYKHLFCDTELTCVADITGRKIVSNLMFPHNHYSIGKSEIDDVYRKNDATNAEGERIFLERYKRNFDLSPGNKIQDKGMINWLQKRHVYA